MPRWLRQPRGNDPAALFDGQGELVRLHSGSVVYRQGDVSDAVYRIESGRIRIEAEVFGERRVVRESSPGELIGTLGLYTGNPRSSTAIAARDTELRRIPKDEFTRLMESNPQALWAFGRMCVNNVSRRYSARKNRNMASLRTLALFPAQAELPREMLAAELAAEFGARGPCRAIDAGAVDAALGPGSAHVRVTDEAGNARLAAWLSEQESEHRFLIYLCDAEPDSAWNRRCLRQADRVLVAARPDRAVTLGGDLEAYLAEEVHAPVECVFLSDTPPDAPLTPWAWREACRAEMHHWVDPGATAPLARLARMINGEAVGMVLGGGGARGFAHLGLLRALERHGVTVDLYGGTSMGALMAGLAATGRDAAQIEEDMRELFLRRNNLNDYVVPRVSLIAARKLRRRIEVMFANQRIELLPQPFFCVTTNMTQGESLVHERGPVAHWVGASMSVPGIAPPVAYRGDLLVDGAVLNNVPSDVMRTLGRGPVIASDVTAAENLDIPGTEAGDEAPRQLVRSGRQPNIFKILFRSATLLSPEVRQAREDSADLYLRMPVAGIGMFEWERIDELVEAAFEYSAPAIERWLASDQD